MGGRGGGGGGGEGLINTQQLIVKQKTFLRHSKERSQGDGSFECPLCMFWLRKKKFIFNYTLISKSLYSVY